MVTVLFVVVLSSQVFISSLVDTFYYDRSFIDSFIYVIHPEPGTRKSVGLIAVFIAGLVSVVIDYRVWKGKKSQKQFEGK
ncbi:hypothetical protein [Bacillus suaedaesalsae]|uniref:Uncharacterized protein n=1 Tax=Bacillus suaedaesalsae TaxID=2810349 RepID=A0ABS2DLL1_9BACI|nr:hypothetical protein [Bacillus suaedaesalsae]MBM6619372.1 hypothetical protein [Bacillus suaedaesalsae]